ncbi:serpentine type 7TM GPCR chemoreceptor str domain-containing protein [Ditylenchus destructor]|uniref:Serpentine type 7TM GPCR chemoreceptor str domain-containing protein n=1 Tax=Ditylenchus destructor TaxID=166010 RepID=A0AAD4R051_9BILA|nr:serpentine type 7TM GPCR chemoreceptor str domain-containing protein [Ditylenchus destructor]
MQFFEINGIICFAICTLLSIALIIAIFKSGAGMSGYKPVMLQVCITDFLNSAITFFYMPLYVPAGANAVSYSTGIFSDMFENAPTFTLVVFKVWLFIIVLNLCSPGAQFLYRYMVLCRDFEPSYALYAGIYSVIMLLILAFSMTSSIVTDYVPRCSNLPYREYILTDNPPTADLVVMKALMPIIGAFIPVCIELFGAIIKVNLSSRFMSFLFLAISCWLQFANPLFTILLVESYRKTVFGSFFCASKSSTQVVDMTNSDQSKRN